MHTKKAVLVYDKEETNFHTSYLQTKRHKETKKPKTGNQILTQAAKQQYNMQTLHILFPPVSSFQA